MANTTNFGWETPDDTDLVKDGAAAMRTLGNSIDASFVDLKGGTTGQVLSKNSNTDLDFVWASDATGIPATIFDAKGDIIAATAADTASRLAVGANDTVLTADSSTATGLKWATPSAPAFVGVMVYNSTTQNVANSTDTYPTFNSEYYDTDGFHSTTTNTSRLTVPAGLGGYYLITGFLSFEGNATGYRQAGIAINVTTEITPVLYSSVGTASTVLNFHYIANLSAGDYVEMRLIQNSGGTLFIYGGGSSRFGMTKL
jgi:hypothetical protein